MRSMSFLVSTLLLFTGTAFAQTANWWEKVQLNADFRYRHEYVTKTRVTDNADTHRERFRLRFGASAQAAEKIKIKFRLASGQDGDALSTNQTFTNNSTRKDIYIDQALVEWSAYEGGTFNLGKMENPLRVLGQSQLIYDVDYSPEGAAYIGQHGAVFSRLAGFSIQERSTQATTGTSEPDSWLLAALLGYKADINESLAFTTAVGYHNFTALKKNPALPTSATATTSFYGNSNSGARYTNDYQVGELLGELRYRQSTWAAGVWFDAINNFATDEDNQGILTGATWQTLDDKAKPVWTLAYTYQALAKDATVSAVNNGDPGNGMDGSHGHLFQVGRALNPNTSLMLSYYNIHVDNDGTPFTTDRGLLDLIVSF